MAAKLGIAAERVTPSTFAVAPASSCAARHGTGIRSRLSQTASIAISSSTRRGIGALRGTLTMSARRGLNRLRFSGRFGRWALLAGAYVATIRAASTGETVVAAPVSFRMVTRRR